MPNYGLTNQLRQPCVYIVDSPSPQDLVDGYSIGMALRDSLQAIKIPHYYTLAVDYSTFHDAMTQRLSNYTKWWQTNNNIDAIPLIHLCMHGADQGIVLTNQHFINWDNLRHLLRAHNLIKNYNPLVCMASCNGISASSMAHAYESVFSYLIGNTGAVLQSDLTVAYLAFYNQIIWKGSTIDQAVTSMKLASGDQNFYYAVGEDLRNYHFNNNYRI